MTLGEIIGITVVIVISLISVAWKHPKPYSKLSKILTYIIIFLFVEYSVVAGSFYFYYYYEIKKLFPDNHDVVYKIYDHFNNVFPNFWIILIIYIVIITFLSGLEFIHDFFKDDAKKPEQ